MQNTISKPSISALTVFFYIAFGGALLTVSLFPPVWVKTLTGAIAWNPVTPTIISRPPAPAQNTQAVVGNSSPTNINGQSCQQWAGLNSEQVSGAQSLLDGNPLATNLSFTEVPGKYTISAISPANEGKKQILAKKLNELSIATDSSIILPNGNKAWFIGTAKDQSLAQSIKADFASKGVWNLSIDAKPSSHSVQFYTSSSEFINKINAFSQERGIPSLTPCQ